MTQLDMFDNGPSFPLTHEGILALFHQYIDEGEKDSDVFTWEETKQGKSYFIYGKKVFEHRPGDIKKARIVIFEEIESEKEGETIVELKPRSKSPEMMPPDVLLQWLEDLKQKKRAIFRGLITEKFACCNDYMKCSRAGMCIHQNDRFYNGCTYRTNLEAGRNFFREDS